jgi:hypothetical protein
MTDLPGCRLRVRENGAAVFRVDTANRQQRIDMDQIAVFNMRNGEIKLRGDVVLSDADRSAIEDWMAGRTRVLAARKLDDIHRAVDHLNQTAQWARSKASDHELEEMIGFRSGQVLKRKCSTSPSLTT